MQESTYPSYRRDHHLLITGMIIGCVVIFGAVMLVWNYMVPSDYVVHNGLIVQFVQTPGEFLRNVPHFLYHVLGSLPYRIIGSEQLAGALVMTFSYVALLVIVYEYLLRIAAPDHSRRVLLLVGALSFGFLFVTPLGFVTPQTMYFGYFYPHVFHNPTFNIMMPFAVALLLAVLPLFTQADQRRLSPRWIPAYALLTACCLLAKPNFVLAFIPSLGVVTGVRMLWLMRETIHKAKNDVLQPPLLPVVLLHWWRTTNWYLLIGGIVLPAFIILLIQTMTWTSSGGITLDPLRVQFEWTLHYDEAANQLLPLKFVLSAAFPLLVYVLYIRRAWNHLLFNLGWMTYFVGAAMSYLLVDNTVIAAGDFIWSGGAGALALFAAATVFLVQQIAPQIASVTDVADLTPQEWSRIGASLALFAFHVLAGVQWYIIHLTNGSLDVLYGVW